MKMHRTGKLIAGILAALIVVQCVYLTCFAENNGGDVISGDISDTSTVSSSANLPSIFGYIEQIDAVYPEDSITVLENATELSSGQSLKTSFEVNRAGLYAIKFSYSIVNSFGQYPVISLYINGKIPYKEAQSLNLMRKWENKKIGQEPLTDATLPKQNELYDIQTCYLRDTVKYYGDILYFYLNEGTNTLEIQMDSETN